jgi:arsenate reductase
MAVRIYHNPLCSKSRTTLELLRRHGEEPEIVEYLRTPPDQATLTDLLGMLGLGARAILRTGEPAYRELGLDQPDLTDAELIAAMAERPELIERPIVVAGGQARIGRPPEQVLDLLDR